MRAQFFDQHPVNCMELEPLTDPSLMPKVTEGDPRYRVACGTIWPWLMSQHNYGARGVE